MQVWNATFPRRILSVVVSALLVSAPAAFAANPSASGTLTVTATVTSSLALTFNTATSGPTITGAGSNAATLPFGNIAAYGTEPTGVTLESSSTSLAVCGTCFVVSAPVTVAVTQADGSSSNFTLTAELGTADTQNYWAAGTQSTQLSSTSAKTISSSGAYGTTGNTVLVYLGVPNSTVTTPSISNTINFVATAN